MLREQYRSLATLVPTLYTVVLITLIVITFATREIAPVLLTLILLTPLAAVVISRLRYWRKARGHVETRDIAIIRRDMVATTILGPALTLSFTIIGSISIPDGASLTKLLMLVVIWITAMACAFCLFALPRAAVLVVIAASAPLTVAFLREGGETMGLLAGVLVMISGLVAQMLRENFRNFCEIVRSRFVIEEKRAQAEAAQREAETARDTAALLANTDALTGLSNRRHFEALLEARARDPALRKTPFAVGMLDLDGFKPVNDLYGHGAGDEALKLVAERLSAVMRGKGCVARMGGDEFAVIVEGVGTQAEAIVRGREIQACFAKPFPVAGALLRLNATCGFCLHACAVGEPARLLDRADMALYRIKAKERGGVAVFDAHDESLAIERAKIEAALRGAVANDGFDVEFQPIVDLATGRVDGFEALARWIDPVLGSISPSVFIPLAEQNGLIGEITDLVLRKAATIAATWPDPVALSFNISAEQLSKPSAGERIVSIVAACGLPIDRFEIEVTETAVMRDVGAAKRILERLRAAGARVALDDFGAGYSSLSQIRELPFDRVKIDKSFIDDMCRDARIARLVRSLIEMCNGLGLACVAEGIEHPEQLVALKLFGCKWGQGYLISRPLAKEDARRLLDEPARDAA